VQVSQGEYNLNVPENEPLRQDYSLDINPWPTTTIKLQTGEAMNICEVKKEAGNIFIECVRKALDVEHDFYDIVGTRVYSELFD